MEMFVGKPLMEDSAVVFGVGDVFLEGRMEERSRLCLIVEWVARRVFSLLRKLSQTSCRVTEMWNQDGPPKTLPFR